MDLSIVIPVYNEVEALPSLYVALVETLERLNKSADLARITCAAARLRLHAEGLSAGSRRGCAPLRRDAPFHPDLRRLGRRLGCRTTGRPPPAPLWQIEIRARSRCSRAARSVHPLFHRPRIRPADPVLREVRDGLSVALIRELRLGGGAEICL